MSKTLMRIALVQVLLLVGGSCSRTADNRDARGATSSTSVPAESWDGACESDYTGLVPANMTDAALEAAVAKLDAECKQLFKEHPTVNYSQLLLYLLLRRAPEGDSETPRIRLLLSIGVVRVGVRFTGAACRDRTAGGRVLFILDFDPRSAERMRDIGFTDITDLVSDEEWKAVPGGVELRSPGDEACASTYRWATDTVMEVESHP